MSSTTYSKVKGRVWETDIVKYLQAAGFKHAERRRLAGARDRGDIAGFPGLVIEAKNETPYRIPEWLREAEQERINDNAEWCVVWARRKGKPDPADGFVIMTGKQFLGMLLDGWGDYVGDPYLRSQRTRW